MQVIAFNTLTVAFSAVFINWSDPSATEGRYEK